MQTEEELVEIALFRYAQQRATKWGAERFAAEYARRELEERWLEAARSNTTPYGTASPADAAGSPTGPVDASAQEHVVGSPQDAWVLSRPKHARHPSVPRPPTAEPEVERRRPRRRQRDRSPEDPARLISPAEAARMSPAGRRLYGLDDPPPLT